MSERQEPSCPTIGEIQARVCAARRVSPLELISARRRRSVTDARQLAMYLAKTLTTKSLPQIGRSFGRDHTTVIHAVRKVEQLLAGDRGLRVEVRRLSVELAPDLVAAGMTGGDALPCRSPPPRGGASAFGAQTINEEDLRWA